MTYTFRNRFKIGEGYRLAVDAPDYTLAVTSDTRIVLRAGTGDKNIADTDQLILQGTGYASYDQAVEDGRRWRQYLTGGLAHIQIAVNLGDDDDEKIDARTRNIVDHDFFRRLGVRGGDRIFDDRIGLIVCPTDPDAKFLFGYAGAGVTVGRGIEGLAATIRDIRESRSGPWTSAETLAYELVHIALSTPPPDLKYIVLVTAVEAIIPPRGPIAADVAAVIDTLIGSLNELSNAPEPAKQRVAQLLREDKRESIARAARTFIEQTLTGQYGGRTAADYFKDAYNVRSALVHGDTKRPTASQLTKRNPELLRFTLDLLESHAARP